MWCSFCQRWSHSGYTNAIERSLTRQLPPVQTFLAGCLVSRCGIFPCVPHQLLVIMFVWLFVASYLISGKRFRMNETLIHLRMMEKGNTAWEASSAVIPTIWTTSFRGFSIFLCWCLCAFYWVFVDVCVLFIESLLMSVCFFIESLLMSVRFLLSRCWCLCVFYWVFVDVCVLFIESSDASPYFTETLHNIKYVKITLLTKFSKKINSILPKLIYVKNKI